MYQKRLRLMGFMAIVLLFTASPALAESGAFSIGAMGGWAWSVVDHAAEGSSTQFPDTQFESHGVYGGSIMYRFPFGFALELCVEHLTMDLKELGDNYGTLKMTPVMLLLKQQGMPKAGTGFTGHADIGGGISLNSFDKGTATTNAENALGVTFPIKVDNSFVFEVGGGLDYFFTKNISVNLDGRFLLTNVGTSGWGRLDLNKFYASNFQALFGVRYWFK
jgi:opacity protein-like surface antigen